MSDYLTLSSTQKNNQKSIFKNNINAKNGENELMLAVKICHSKLRKHYDSTSIDFNFTKKIPHSAIINETKKYFGEDHDYFENNTTYFKPDGGVTYYDLQTQKNMSLNTAPLFTAEYKKQGDGKDQARGNAIERSYKNVKEYELLTINSPFCLFFLFCSGDDFKKVSTIRDRLTGLTLKRPLNKTYFKKERGHPSCSVYLQDKGYWNKETMSQIMFEGCKQAIDFYLIKNNINVQFTNL
jgi:hypothetical protein